MSADDSELIQRYSRFGDEQAFAEVVNRHLNLVWSAAFRTTGDSETARDVAQSVFTDLARKARYFPAETTVPGWLYRAAIFAARKAVRTSTRRTLREKEAMKLHVNDSSDLAADSEQILPLLDEALGCLSQTDREAIVLRFFTQKSLGEISQVFSVSEDAAQKRISRALEKMRGFFRRRGQLLSSGAIAAALGGAGAQSAPAGISAAIVHASLSAAATTGFAGTIGIVASAARDQFIFMKTQILIGTIATAMLGTPLILQHQTLASLRTEQGKLSGTVAGIPELEARRARLAEAERVRIEWEQLKRDHDELQQLRSETDEIRGRLGALAPATLRDLENARADLERARATAKFEQEKVNAQKLRLDTISSLKNLGLAARIYATDNQDVFPKTFEAITNEIGGTLPGGLALDRFEFMRHEREVSESEPEMILFREKEPRQMPDGTWARAYTFCDGSVQEVKLPERNFEEFEKQHTAQKAATQAAR